MTKLIITIILFTSSLIMNGQTKFEQGMQKGMDLWKEGKTTEASALFERIAVAEPNSWLPNYYVALITTTTAFLTKDKEKIAPLLQKAQSTLDIELNKMPENAELLVMQAMIYTAWIVADPMANGMKYGNKTLEIYNRAEKIDPKNPRVVFCKAEFEIGGAQFWGTDIRPMCEQIEQSIELFATFKPESAFHPSWGLDRAQAVLKGCKK